MILSLKIQQNIDCPEEEQYPATGEVSIHITDYRGGKRRARSEVVKTGGIGNVLGVEGGDVGRVKRIDRKWW